ncbi:hypothetical protein VNO77_27728 [Canavalia gladiata]|uniref:Uncharacterized protein n=1 Tax=Canavalia gladiata TaxID=3824 RepID=A0AAN9KXF4_CANGL
MAWSKLVSLPISFTKMFLHLESKFSSLAIRSSNVPYPTHQCKASNKLSNNGEIKVRRRSGNFKPSIWTYDYIQSLSSEYKEEKYLEQGRVLREEVRLMLGRLENQLDQLELIDVLQRLGIAYHFSDEISNILDNIYKMDAFKRKKNLYATALEFRLLRQHGYDISTDVFSCFQDEMGNFKKSLSTDVEGMLSLYEASFHLLEGETSLDEERDFTSQFLKEYLNQNKGDHISLLISHALELPLHWRIPRWEAQWFINACDRKQNMSPALIQLAKLDFNTLQAIYQDELKYTSRWWKRTLLVDKLNFSRDRLLENFIWTVGTNFHPNFGYFRRAITKINVLITTIDDVYDIFGTLDELELFTMAIDRWDLNTMDSLPDYMRTCFQTLYNFVDEMALEYTKKNGYNITPYLKKSACKGLTALALSTWAIKGPLNMLGCGFPLGFHDSFHPPRANVQFGLNGRAPSDHIETVLAYLDQKTRAPCIAGFDQSSCRWKTPWSTLFRGFAISFQTRIGSTLESSGIIDVWMMRHPWLLTLHRMGIGRGWLEGPSFILASRILQAKPCNQCLKWLKEISEAGEGSMWLH